MHANGVLKKGIGSRSVHENVGNLLSRERAYPLFQWAAKE